MIVTTHARAMRRHIEAAIEQLQWTLTDIASDNPATLSGRLGMAYSEVEQALELANDMEPTKDPDGEP